MTATLNNRIGITSLSLSFNTKDLATLSHYIHLKKIYNHLGHPISRPQAIYGIVKEFIESVARPFVKEKR